MNTTQDGYRKERFVTWVEEEGSCQLAFRVFSQQAFPGAFRLVWWVSGQESWLLLEQWWLRFW
jgi:hypothetical protein